MAMMFGWFVFSLAVGFLASSRGRSGLAWFFLALLISPLVAFVIVMMTKNLRPEQRHAALAPGPTTHVKCPSCAEWVLPEAIKCKHCGSTLTPDPTHAVRAAQNAADTNLKNTSQAGTAFLAAVAIMAVTLTLLFSCRG